MAKPRSPNRDKAFELFKKANGNIKNRDIATQLNISEKTVGGWKSKDNWVKELNGVLQTDKRSTPKKAGAPKGNKNAVGNDGGAPKKNKNAVKTGEYETIYSAYMTDEEKSLFDEQVDSSLVLSEEIHFLRVRQMRMLKRLRDAENGLNDNEKTILYELRGRKTLIEAKGKKVPVDIDEQLTQTEKQERITRKIDDVLRIEEALTRISNQLTRTIKQYEESLLLNDKKLIKKEQVNKLKAEVQVLQKSVGGNKLSTDWKEALKEVERGKFGEIADE